MDNERLAASGTRLLIARPRSSSQDEGSGGEVAAAPSLRPAAAAPAAVALARAGRGRRSERRSRGPGSTVLAGVADRRLAVEEVADLVAGQRLVFEQALGQRLELVAASRSGCGGRRRGPSSTRRRTSASIFWAVASETFCVRAHRHAEEDLFLVLAVGDRAELVARSPSGSPSCGRGGSPARCRTARRR